MGITRAARQLVGQTLFAALVIFLYRLATTNSGEHNGGGGGGGSVNNVANSVSNSVYKLIKPQEDGPVDLDHDKAVIVAATRFVDTTWVEQELPDWKRFVYIADDPTAPLHPEENKGNEAGVYLQYLVDHYDALPATMVFVHGHAEAIHVDNAFDSNAATIRALKLDYVQREGYASLRCMDEPGCICAPMRHWNIREEEYERAWSSMFPDTRCPEMVLAPCCAQFAVSRTQVRARPRAEYARFLAWVRGTPLRDERSGRIMEYMWHVIFGREPLLCADEQRCYCDKFGLCDPDPKRGFHPEDFNWLAGHACAKRAPK